ncbi:hypothetical protein Tco_1372837, partial [Tanacetum coccineum]
LSLERNLIDALIQAGLHLNPLYVKRNNDFQGKTVSTINYSSMSNVTNSAAAGLSNPSMALTTEHMLKLISLVNEKPVPTTNSTLLAGENQHMTVSANFLMNVVDVSNLGLTVGHPNGTHTLIIKIGDLKINDHITLYNVLVVPKYKVSLLSVHKLARDNNLFVGFDDHKCYIQDLKENKIVGIGNVNDGLYLFNIDSACFLLLFCLARVYILLCLDKIQHSLTLELLVVSDMLLS